MAFGKPGQDHHQCDRRGVYGSYKFGVFEREVDGGHEAQRYSSWNVPNGPVGRDDENEANAADQACAKSDEGKGDKGQQDVLDIRTSHFWKCELYPDGGEERGCEAHHGNGFFYGSQRIIGWSHVW